MNKVGVLIKKDPRGLPRLSHPVGHSWRNGPSAHSEPAGAFVLGDSASGTVRNKCLLFLSHTVYGVL